MTSTPLTHEPRTPGRSALVTTGTGWVAGLVGYLLGRVLITAVGPAPGWLNLLLVLVMPVLSALAATLVVPPGWLRGTRGTLRHALVAVPVPLVFTLIALADRPAQVAAGPLTLMMLAVMLVGTLAGAFAGRLLRRDPDRPSPVGY